MITIIYWLGGSCLNWQHPRAPKNRANTMKKKDDKKEDEQGKLALKDALDATRLIFGAKKPQDGLNEPDRDIKDDSEEGPGMKSFFKKVIERRDAAIKREQINILDGLGYPGGKRVH